MAARLHDEYIGAAYILENLQINFPIAEAFQPHLAELGAQMLADALRQGAIRCARKNFEAIVVHSSVAPINLRRRATLTNSRCDGAQSYNKGTPNSRNDLADENAERNKQDGCKRSLEATA